MNTRCPSRGFTLVELLVVTGLLASLFALLTVGSKPSEKGSVRRAAQELASAILAAQTRAIGRPEGGGIVIRPDTTSARMGTAVLEALTHTLATESLGPWPPSGFNDSFRTARVTSGTIRMTDPTILPNAYKARLQTPLNDPISPWFSLTPLGTGSATMSFRASAGQSIESAGWPPQTPATVHIAVAQYPSTAAPVSAFNRQVAIDLRHSGLGDDPAASHGYGSLENLGTIAVLFDEVGRASEIMRRIQETRTSSDQPSTLTDPVYLLLATRNDIQQGLSLASQNSLWLAINPLTGRAIISENIPQSGVDAAALRAARKNAKDGVPLR